MARWIFFKALLGTRVELAKMDFAYLGRPFVQVPAKSAVDVTTLDYAYLGRPFVVYARG